MKNKNKTNENKPVRYSVTENTDCTLSNNILLLQPVRSSSNLIVVQVQNEQHEATAYFRDICLIHIYSIVIARHEIVFFMVSTAKCQTLFSSPINYF